MRNEIQRWRPGIWLRPNNLVAGLDQLCVDVSALGLEKPNTTACLAETLELGGDMIRALLMDPLLLDSLMGDTHGTQLIAELKCYDIAGRRLWRQFIQAL